MNSRHLLITLIFLLILVKPASALEVPDQLSLSFEFDEPKDQNPTFKETTSFEIDNPVNKTTNFSISTPYMSGFEFNLDPISGTIYPHNSKDIEFEVLADNSLGEGKHSGTLTIQGDSQSYEVPIELTVDYHVELDVKDNRVDFGKVDVSESKQVGVTFEEKLGYKAVSVTLDKRSGEDWISTSNSFEVDAGSSKTIYFQLSGNKPGWQDLYRSEGDVDWKYYANSEGGDQRIYLSGEIKLPARLDASGGSTVIHFNKPKRFDPSYSGSLQVRVENEGYYSMDIQSLRLSGLEDCNAKFKSKPTEVGDYDSEQIVIEVNVPSSLSEGKHTGEVYIDAGSAGSEKIGVSVRIVHEVKLSISSTELDYGELTILEEGKKSIELREDLGYKSIKNVVVRKESGEEWIDVSPSSYPGIPAGEKVGLDFTLKPRGEAVPGTDYTWEYKINTENAGSKEIKLSARVTLAELKPKLEELRDDLAKYEVPSAYRGVIDEMIDAHKSAEKVGGEDYSDIWTTVSNYVYILNKIKDYNEEDDASHIVTASTVLDRIPENFKDISNSNAREEVSSSYTKLKEFFKSYVSEEASKHAQKGENYENNNYLMATRTYKEASRLYSSIGDDEKAEKYLELANNAMNQHDKLIEEANNKRVKAIDNKQEAKSMMYEIVGSNFILNPVLFDDVSQDYREAINLYSDTIDNYVTAGEVRLENSAEEELNQLKTNWYNIKIKFYAYTALLILLFIALTYMISKGTISYIRDVNEIKKGEDVNP